MTLIIENIKDEFLPAYTELVKNTNATIIAQHDDMQKAEVQEAIAEFEAEQRREVRQSDTKALQSLKGLYKLMDSPNMS